ncbi:HNH endonuclease signature motif containing protein [Citrobacter freundii]|uniref:HNH endonuclease signature motif containing protein n=1 Tax=Citrobacter freundii TaxID=546 RepID=UPI00292AB0FC|nr:HNH endonuclease signature motif containing protein [Citrobacter freundii]MEB0406710.1 HNH endonuclease signature motif containing protein [Citrobacter freundii]
MYAYTDGRSLNGSRLTKALSVHSKLINGLSRGIKLKPVKASSKKRPSEPTLADKRREAKQKVNMGWEALIRTMPMQTPGARKNPKTEALWENARRRGSSQASTPAFTPKIIPCEVSAQINTDLPGLQSTQMENPKRYDSVSMTSNVATKLDNRGLQDFMAKHIPASQRRDVELYIHKHQHEATTAIELAQRYLDELEEKQIIREADKLADVVPDLVAVVVEEKPALALGQPVKLHSTRTAQRTVEQRDVTAHMQFVEWVWRNFAGRCAVTGWQNGERLQAAHIEPATSGNFSADNGLLLTPTIHDLMDAGLMAVNPETMTVHFAPGIELGAMFEGKVIEPKLWPLNMVALVKRWKERKF